MMCNSCMELAKKLADAMRVVEAAKAVRQTDHDDTPLNEWDAKVMALYKALDELEGTK